MNKLILATTACLAIASGSPAMARTATSIGAMSGTCSSLKTPELDFALPCNGKVVNTVWNDGRASFTFTATLPNGTMAFTFSGMASQEVHPDADTAVQPVDTLLFNMTGLPPARPEHSVGSCRYTNPFNGVATVDCTVQTKGGPVEAHFTTDGRPPVFIH